MSRDKIICGGIREFAEKGYFKASMDDIAGRSNVAKGTLYYHFKSKAFLFKAILTEGIEFIIGEIQHTLNENMSPRKQVEKIIAKQIDLYLEYRELAKLFFNEISNGIDEDTLNEVKRLKQRYVSFISSQLEAGNRVGVIEKVDFEVTAVGLIGYIDSICSMYLDNEDRLEKQDLVDSVMRLLDNIFVEK